MLLGQSDAVGARLQREVGRADGERVEGGRRRSRRQVAEDDHRDLGVGAPDLGERLETVHDGHVQIEDHHVGPEDLELVERDRVRRALHR